MLVKSTYVYVFLIKWKKIHLVSFNNLMICLIIYNCASYYGSISLLIVKRITISSKLWNSHKFLTHLSFLILVSVNTCSTCFNMYLYIAKKGHELTGIIYNLFIKTKTHWSSRFWWYTDFAGLRNLRNQRKGCFKLGRQLSRRS